MQTPAEGRASSAAVLLGCATRIRSGAIRSPDVSPAETVASVNAVRIHPHMLQNCVGASVMRACPVTFMSLDA